MASSLSDKAIFIYDTFFSADITQGQLDSQIRQSSLFRLAFEEVLSYPNLLDEMKAHDRYDELIGLTTEAYNMIFSNITREENSKLEANAYIFITTKTNTQADFTAFLKTVSGHIGFGAIINNPKTAYDIAGNTHAVQLILANSSAIDALLNSQNGLEAFGKDSNSSLQIFQQAEVFKQLRASLRFNQEGVLPASITSDVWPYLKKIGEKYIQMISNTNYVFVSDDMYTWTKYFIPNDSTGNVFSVNANQYQGDMVGYDRLNKAYFFISVRNNAKIKWTKDFVTWKDVIHSVGSTNIRTLSTWDDKTWFYDYTSSNVWQLSYIQAQEGAVEYIPTQVANPNSISVNGKAPEDPDFPYMVWWDVNYNWKYMDKDADFPYRVKDQSSHFYAFDSTNNRTARGISYGNGYFFFTFGTAAQMGISRIDLRYDNDMLWTSNIGNIDSTGAKVTYWYNYNTNDYFYVSYANGVYIIPITGGYATSTNGVVWDEQLFDVTYKFNIKGADQRGFYGNVPGTNFVLTSYDSTRSLVSEEITTTTTTAAVSSGLPEGLSELECLIDTTSSSILQYNGPKMVFNNKDYYENTNYVVTNGVYKILNVPEQYPIAVLNRGKSDKITYTGNKLKKHFSKTIGTDADGVYDFFYGDVTIKVTGNFDRVSLYYYKKPGFSGYLGMEKILVHQDTLSLLGTTAADTVNKVSSTSIFSSSIKNFNCIGNEGLEQTDLVNVVHATTTTTEVPSYTVILPETTSTSTVAPDYGDENFTTGISLSTGTEYAIDINASNLLTIDGVTFDSVATAGNRYRLGAGTYTFNVAEDKPVAFEGATSSPFFGPQHSNVSYSGDFYKRSTKQIGSESYYFYHGQIILIVDEPFVTLNLVAFSASATVASNAFSWDRSTTTTTTAAPTTTSTTDAATTYTKCTLPSTVITAVGGYYLFDADPFETNTKIGLSTGVYVLKNIPQSHPIAILNYGKWNYISYTGSGMKSITHTAADGYQYPYYYGDVTITVSGNFGIISYDCSNHGYMGGQNRLIFSSNCPISTQPITTTTTTLDPLSEHIITTTGAPGGLRVGQPTTTTTTLLATTSTTTTAAPTSAQYCLVSGASGNTVTYAGGNILFNGNSGLYGMITGTYIFKNVTASHPMAFLNYGKTSNITYSGQYNAGSKQGADGYQYPYYYGDVTVTVNGNFGFLSYECFYHGYMGGENNIIFDNTSCT
jgi:hypothetical protein